jgi:hypothetical protein
MKHLLSYGLRWPDVIFFEPLPVWPDVNPCDFFPFMAQLPGHLWFLFRAADIVKQVGMNFSHQP